MKDGQCEFIIIQDLYSVHSTLQHEGTQYRQLNTEDVELESNISQDESLASMDSASQPPVTWALALVYTSSVFSVRLACDCVAHVCAFCLQCIQLQTEKKMLHAFFFFWMHVKVL